MAIAVICPGCKASFRVSEKFAGKKGPCPKCKAQIEIPKVDAVEVKVHEPEAYASAGKDAKGRAIAKPIPRADKKIGAPLLIIVFGCVLVATLAAWMLGEKLQNTPILRLAGALVLAPPLALLAYGILRDDELEPHRGISLWIRTAICSVVYAGLWLGFHFVPQEFTTELYQWFFIAPPFLLVGAFTALACYDLEFSSAFLHYAFYLFATILLRLLAGMPLWTAAASG